LITNNRLYSVLGCIFTIILAIIFTYLQYEEYNASGFTMGDSIYGSVFYATTGLHGGHVLVGTLFIFIQFVRLLHYQLTGSHHLGYELGIMY
jgi:cytochrome c oxidase subunit 3